MSKPKSETAHPSVLSESGFGIALLISGIIVTIILSLAGAPILVKEPLAAAVGVDQFAIFYLMAQLIERLIEPFSEKSLTSHDLFGNTDTIKKNTEELKMLESKPQEKELLKITKLKNDMDPEKTTRTISMWGLASLMGMILCYFTVGLFEVVGTPFVLSVHIFGGILNGHTLDAILSGIIIGGGTKPLHDLISYVEKAKTS